MFFAFAHETFDLPNAGKIIVQERVHGRGSAALQTITPMSGERVPKRAAGQKRQRRQADAARVSSSDKTSPPSTMMICKTATDALLNAIDQHALD